jgi:hypothetical protein
MTRRALSGLLLLALLVSLTGPAWARPEPFPAGPALVYVALPTPASLAQFERTGLPAYARLRGHAGEYLLAGADPAGLKLLTVAGLSVRILDSDATAAGAAYYLAYPMPGQPQPRWSDYGRALLDDGVQVLLRASPEEAGRLAEVGVALQALTRDPKPLRPAWAGPAFARRAEFAPYIQTMINQVYTDTVRQYDGDLSGAWPTVIGGAGYTIATRHSASGVPIQKATQYVGEHLAARGLTVEYHVWNASRPPNVIGELRGETNPNDIYVICGHLDDMPSGSIAPGADDNASGSVAVLIAADILTQYRWGCTLRFAFWTGEEQGLYGSAAYAKRAHDNGENIVGVLNLDMIAWNTSSSSPGIDLHAKSTMPGTLALAQLFADVVSAYHLNLIPEIVPNGTGSSDHASFWSYGYTAILGIEDFSDFNPQYHTTQDRLNTLDLTYFTNFVKASVGTFASMSGCLIPSGTGYVNGHVTATYSGLPIANATVVLSDQASHTYSATTDVTGYYTRSLPNATYTMTAAAPTYTPAMIAPVIVSTGTVTTQDFALANIRFYLPIVMKGG